MKSTPTQADIAREAGVSRGLVSLALSGSPSVADATKERILEVAKRLGYTRNLGAAMLAARTSPVVGIVLPHLMHPFFDAIVTHTQHAADERGMMALSAIRGDISQSESCALDSFIGLRVGGVILVAPTLPQDQLLEYGAKLPMCILAGDSPGGNLDAVYIDEDAAANLVVDHLLESGYKKIVFFTRKRTAADEMVSRRIQGYKSACKKAGIEPDIRYVEEVQDCMAKFVDEGHEKPAIISFNDPVAMDVVIALRTLGLTPGKDVGVVGYDNTFFAAKREFDITSVDPRPVEMTQQAIEFLRTRALDYDAPGRDHILTPGLAVRGSTSA